jgi:hypothetical protein
MRGHLVRTTLLAAGVAVSGLAGCRTPGRVGTDGPAASEAPLQHCSGPAAPATGRIAFVSDRTGNLEIFTVNADGTGLTQLTRDPATDDHPA